MQGGYEDLDKLADSLARKYGLSALDVLAERDKHIEVIKDIKTITDALNPKMSTVLLLTGAGDTQRQIGEKLGLTHQQVSNVLKGARTALQNIADEDRIQFLANKVVEMAKTSRGRHSALYNDLCNELDKRFSVRQALKRLFVNLRPPASQKEMESHISMPAYPYERAKDVSIGMRNGVLNGYHVMRTVSKCKIPEYLSDTNSSSVCCNICSVCKRKKDVCGRAGYDKWGYEKSYSEVVKEQKAEREKWIEYYHSTGELPQKGTSAWEMLTLQSRSDAKI